MFKNYEDSLFNDKTILYHNYDLKASFMRYIQEKSIKLHYVVMMIRDCKYVIEFNISICNKCFQSM